MVEKRTCKSYNVKGVEWVKIKVGTIEKKNTKAFYAIGKTKLTYSGKEDAFEKYKAVSNEIDTFIEEEIKKCPFLEESCIITRDVSENNLRRKKYTKMVYEIYMKLSAPIDIDKAMPYIEPFILKIFDKVKTLYNRHKFVFC